MPAERNLATKQPYFAAPAGLMHGVSPWMSPFSAGAMQQWLDQIHGYYGQFMYDIPQTLHLRILDYQGEPLPGANVTMYQLAERPDQGVVISEQVKALGVTDAGGFFVLPNVDIDEALVPPTATGDQLRDNPFGYLAVVGTNGLLHFEVEREGQTDYAWLDITEANVAYWQGQTAQAVFERQLQLNKPLQSEPPADMAEPAAGPWTAWAEASTATATYDASNKLAGEAALRLVTDGGFDTYVRYPGEAVGRWDLTGADDLSLSFLAENPNGFQSGSPWIRLIDADGDYYEYQYYRHGWPHDLLNEARGEWQTYQIPLDAPDWVDDGWRGSAQGTVDLANIQYLEIHADTWDYGFSLWIDGVGFASGHAVTNTHDSGPGSLRQAILDANASPRPARIVFELPVSDAGFVDTDSALPGGDAEPDAFVIQPLTPLPPLQNAASFGITLDGGTQAALTGDTNPFGPEIILDGSSIDPGLHGPADGLWLLGSGNEVAGLNIRRFPGSGIRIGGNGNRVSGSYIGTDSTGAAGTWGNRGDGILIDQAPGTTVSSNLVSDNLGHGIRIFGPAARGNIVQANRIGTDASGRLAAGNGGIGVYLDQAPDNLVGGWEPDQGKTISANAAEGIAVYGESARGNRIVGNWIGAEYGGTGPLGNGSDGVWIGSAWDTLLAENLISSNQRSGVAVMGIQAADLPLAQWTAGGGNGHHYLRLPFMSWSDAEATAMAMGGYLASITSQAEQDFLSACAGEQAWIGLTDRAEEGVWSWTSGEAGSYLNWSEGQPDNADGDEHYAVLNWSGSGAWNDLSDRELRFALVEFETEPDLDRIRAAVGGGRTLVQGNGVLDNLDVGVALTLGAHDHTVRANLISLNGAMGVRIVDDGSDDNLVQDNLIGTDPAGLAAAGNGMFGIAVGGCAGNRLIGNLIGGNASHGIDLSHVRGTLVEGNRLGVGADGSTDLGNGGAGVYLHQASGSQIGGVAPGEGNMIAFNAGAGIAVVGPAALQNSLRGNAIWANGGLGIDLGEDGVTANDLLDADTGPNGLQNYPTLRRFVTGAATRVVGTLHSLALESFSLDFYASRAVDPSGHGEGQRYLGTAVVSTDEDGDAAFDILLDGIGTAADEVVTATATRQATGETSEFSAGPAMIAGRHIFYNHSHFDGNDPGADPGDDAAIAVDKAALLPGSRASFANYTSYSRGINGIMIDIFRLADAAQVDETDFEFRVGNDESPAEWATAPAPNSITVRSGAGHGGSDRVTLIWTDGAIQKQWLQVTVQAGGATGLGEPDVFYFGNAVGDSGNAAGNAFADGTDFAAARDNPHTFAAPAAVTDVCDYNRDAFVDGTDLAIVRDHSTNFLNALQLLAIPVATPGGEAIVGPATAGSAEGEGAAGLLAFWVASPNSTASGDFPTPPARLQFLETVAQRAEPVVPPAAGERSPTMRRLTAASRPAESRASHVDTVIRELDLQLTELDSLLADLIADSALRDR